MSQNTLCLIASCFMLRRRLSFNSTHASGAARVVVSAFTKSLTHLKHAAHAMIRGSSFSPASSTKISNHHACLSCADMRRMMEVETFESRSESGTSAASAKARDLLERDKDSAFLIGCTPRRLSQPYSSVLPFRLLPRPDITMTNGCQSSRA